MIFNETLNVSLSDYKCGSCTLYIALFVVYLVTSTIISTVFIYFYWYSRSSKIVYIFFNSMTNIKYFDSSLLSIDQVLFKKILNALFMRFNISKILTMQVLFILFSIM